MPPPLRIYVLLCCCFLGCQTPNTPPQPIYTTADEWDPEWKAWNEQMFPVSVEEIVIATQRMHLIRPEMNNLEIFEILGLAPHFDRCMSGSAGGGVESFFLRRGHSLTISRPVTTLNSPMGALQKVTLEDQTWTPENLTRSR